VERAKFKKSEKVMRKTLIQKNDEKRRFRRSKVKVPKIQKNDEKILFRRSKFKKSEKMIRKDFSGGREAQVQKIRKSDKKRR
jgi:L-cysteine desulfidase